jgi:hypothetical protein
MALDIEAIVDGGWVAANRWAEPALTAGVRPIASTTRRYGGAARTFLKGRYRRGHTVSFDGECSDRHDNAALGELMTVFSAA